LPSRARRIAGDSAPNPLFVDSGAWIALLSTPPPRRGGRDGPRRRVPERSAVSFAVMHERGCRTAMSFDHDFETAGFTLWRMW